MVRTLILIPMMYSKEGLKKILEYVPQDFDGISSEFWSYVEERLKPLEDKVHAIYSEKPTIAEGGCKVDTLLWRLSEKCKNLHCVEDALLAAEAEGWLELGKNGKNRMAMELFEENMRERNRYAISVIDRTLEDGKIGVLFIDPTRRFSFPEDVRVIRMCPFDPVDYLNRHLVKLKIEKKRDS